MITSEKTDLLDKAMFEAQKKIRHAINDKSNPHHKNRYASIVSILDTVKEAGIESDLMIQQFTEEENGRHYLITKVLHSSGQFILSKFNLIIEKPTMQGLGSAITYARRYALQCIFFFASDEKDDDDGEKCDRDYQRQVKTREKKKEEESEFITTEQVDQLVEAHKDFPELKKQALAHFKIIAFTYLKKEHFNLCMAKARDAKESLIKERPCASA